MNTKEMCIWIFGLTLLALVITSPVACTIWRQQTIAEAIKDGADPIAAKCAIEADLDRSAICVLAAARKP